MFLKVNAKRGPEARCTTPPDAKRHRPDGIGTASFAFQRELGSGVLGDSQNYVRVGQSVADPALRGVWCRKGLGARTERSTDGCRVPTTLKRILGNTY